MVKLKFLVVCLFLNTCYLSQDIINDCDVIFVTNSKGFISLDNLSKFKFRFFNSDCDNEIIGYEFYFALEGKSCIFDSDDVFLNEDIIETIKENNDFCKLYFGVKIK